MEKVGAVGDGVHPYVDSGVYQQQDEALPVVEANSVAQPGAIMVHTEDASPQFRAMVSPRRLILLAFYAEYISKLFLLVKRHTLKNSKFRKKNF